MLLIGRSLVEKLLSFCRTHYSLPCSHNPTNDPHSKPDNSSTLLKFILLKCVLTLTFNYAEIFRVTFYFEFFRTKVCINFVFFSIRATCPTHLILMYLITVIMFGEIRKSRNPLWTKFSSFRFFLSLLGFHNSTEVSLILILLSLNLNIGRVTGLQAAAHIFVYTFTISMRATCFVQNIHLDFITLIVFYNHTVNGPWMEPLLCLFSRNLAS